MCGGIAEEGEDGEIRLGGYPGYVMGTGRYTGGRWAQDAHRGWRGHVVTIGRMLAARAAIVGLTQNGNGCIDSMGLKRRLGGLDYGFVV